MTDRPIPFSAPMIRALLDGRKTQTRRMLGSLRRFGSITEFGPSDTAGYQWHFRDKGKRWHDLRHAELLKVLRWQTGDRLYVREAWRTLPRWERLKPTELLAADPVVGVFYEAGGDLGVNVAEGIVQQWHFGWRSKPREDSRLRAGMHLPRWASRLTLTVTDVRVQQLQEISEVDCIAEGPPNVSNIHISGPASGLSGMMVQDPDQPHISMTPRTWYRELWDTINGAGSWDANPFVVAVSFTVERRNIDAARAA